MALQSRVQTEKRLQEPWNASNGESSDVTAFCSSLDLGFSQRHWQPSQAVAGRFQAP